MKKTRTILIPQHTDLWHKFRTTGVFPTDSNDKKLHYQGGTGASEIGTLMLPVEYGMTLMELFHRKVGTEQAKPFINERMLHGSAQETYVGQCWMNWDGNKDTFHINFDKYLNTLEQTYGVMFKDVFNDNSIPDTVIRKAQRHAGYIVHQDYPYLFASLDFKAVNESALMDINHENFKAVKGEQIPVFPIECKTISTDASRNYVYKLPDQYLLQLQLQMLLTDSYYGEIAMLVGGNDFQVQCFERNDSICNSILNVNTKFWEERVIPAREKYRIFKETQSEKYLREAIAYEPLPDSSEPYKTYLSERHKVELTQMLGNQTMLDYVRELVKVRGILKEVGKTETEMLNNLRYWFVKHECEQINFEGEGYIKYFIKEGGKNRELSLRGLKVRVDENEVLESASKINQIIKSE